MLSDSAILHVSLNGDGSFKAARVFGVSLDSEGHPTLGGGTVSLINSLSKDDFGATRAHLAANGSIHPPS